MASSKIPLIGHLDVARVTLASANYKNGFAPVDSSSRITYVVKSGICTVSIHKCKLTQTVSADDELFDGLPTAVSGDVYPFPVHPVNTDYALTFVVTGNKVVSYTNAGSSSLNANIWATLIYPVSDSWSPS